ncbi:hypothetical protein L1887_44095 [Cichorium endivia]|nr:hypothetical protein L1887_44095 [Cichorium endivia]
MGAGRKQRDGYLDGSSSKYAHPLGTSWIRRLERLASGESHFAAAAAAVIKAKRQITFSRSCGFLESKMKKLEDVGVLVARILMPILFIVAGWGKITGYAGTQQYMEAMGVPGFLLPLTILLEFGGGLAVLFGFLTRTTALFTAGFTVLTAFIFHSNFAEGVNSLMFMKNLTIAGGFLLLAVTGPGAYSIDRVLNKKW